MESPRQSPSRRTLMDMTIQGQLVLISKNVYPRAKPVRYRMTSIEKLMVDAVDILALHNKIVKVFDKDGNEVTSADQLQKDQEDSSSIPKLYLSCGEDFAREIGSPMKRHVSPQQDKSPISPANEEAPTKPTPSPKTSKSPAKKAKAHERDAQQRSSTQQPVADDEAFLEATLAVFSSITPEEREQLSSYAHLRQLHNNTQMKVWTSSLLSQGIYSPQSILDQTIAAKVEETLKEASVDGLKIAFTGPRQSGKTSLLFSFSRTIFRKLQEASQLCEYLVIPLNFEREMLEIQDLFKIYRLFISATISAAKASLFCISPYVSSLIQWFLGIPSSVTLHSLPSMEGINEAPIFALGKQFFKTVKETTSLEEFVSLICQFPSAFAKAIGLKGAFFIIDGFEYCDVDISCEEKFISKPVKLSAALCAELNKAGFVVSPQSEQQFLRIFNCTGTTFIDTAGFVRDFDLTKEVAISNISVTLRTKDCLGCPAFVAMLSSIIEKAENIKVEVNKFSGIRASSDVSHAFGLKKEVAHFCELLVKAGSEVINIDMLNELSDDSPLKIKVVNPIEERKNQKVAEVQKKEEIRQKVTPENEKVDIPPKVEPTEKIEVPLKEAESIEALENIIGEKIAEAPKKETDEISIGSKASSKKNPLKHQSSSFRKIELSDSDDAA